MDAVLTLNKIKRREFLFVTSICGAAAFLPGCASRSAPSTIGPAPDSPASREYKRVVASHLYTQNSERIFKGQLPPNLYVIGVLQVDIDRRGRVTRTHWLRAPRHAPEVIQEIERTVRAAAPYPAPSRTVTYTDTWLWDKSGRFQLDTLTEGQL